MGAVRIAMAVNIQGTATLRTDGSMALVLNPVLQPDQQPPIDALTAPSWEEVSKWPRSADKVALTKRMVTTTICNLQRGEHLRTGWGGSWSKSCNHKLQQWFLKPWRQQSARPLQEVPPPQPSTVGAATAVVDDASGDSASDSSSDSDSNSTASRAGPAADRTGELEDELAATQQALEAERVHKPQTTPCQCRPECREC